MKVTELPCGVEGCDYTARNEQLHVAQRIIGRHKNLVHGIKGLNYERNHKHKSTKPNQTKGKEMSDTTTQVKCDQPNCDFITKEGQTPSATKRAIAFHRSVMHGILGEFSRKKRNKKHEQPPSPAPTGAAPQNNGITLGADGLSSKPCDQAGCSFVARNKNGGILNRIIGHHKSIVHGIKGVNHGKYGKGKKNRAKLNGKHSHGELAAAVETEAGQLRIDLDKAREVLNRIPEEYAHCHKCGKAIGKHLLIEIADLLNADKV